MRIRASMQLFVSEWACTIQKLDKAGILENKAASAIVQEIIKEYRANELEEITMENACRQHSCN